MTRSLFAEFRCENFATGHIAAVETHEPLGAPAFLVITALAEGYVPIEQLVGTQAELAHAFPADPERSFWGIIEAATVAARQRADASAPVWEYELRVVSQLSLLERVVDCQIFQEMDVKDVVSQVLEQNGIASDRVEWRLNESYPKYEYKVQYRESSLAFVSRLLEEEGIFFFAEGASEEGETLIFADDSTLAKPIEGGAELPRRARSRLGDDADAILSITDRRRVRSGKFVLRDFDFKKPKLDLTADAEAEQDTDLEVYDYPGGYTDPGEGKRLAQIKLEAEQAAGVTFDITSNCTRIGVGRKITVTDSADFDGDYLVTSVHRSYEHKPGAAAGESAEHYLVSATLIPLDVKFRTPRRTDKPIIPGPQTAVVVAPEGSPDQTTHTEEFGRCKLKFSWDRAEATDDKASAWFRVAQLQTSGSLVLPRVGWEVIVEFLEGDPDRPLLTGRLYNGVFMPPYKLPEGCTRTALQTLSTPGGGGANEIRFEDKAGAEELMIHSQYDTIVKVANNKTKNVGNNDVQTVTAKQSLEVSGNQDTKVTKGNVGEVTADQSVTVGGNREQKIDAVYGLTTGGGATTTVGGNQFQMIGNPLEGLLAVATERAVEQLTKHADNLVDHVNGMVQGAISQVMGPVDAITSAAQTLGEGMQDVANGNLGAAAGLVAGASGLPGASEAMSALGAPPAPAATQTAPGAEASAAADSGANALRAAATSAIQKSMSAASNAVGNALGVGGGGGGESGADNEAGPDGAASGADNSKSTKGPGHHVGAIAGSHTETSAALRIMAVLNGINTNVAVSQTQSIGAAYIEMVLGDHAESTEAVKSETQVGYVVVTKGDETEEVDGVLTTMVGGAVINLIKGDASVSADGPATFIGAFHKIQGKTSVTFKCGAAELVVDDGGVTLEAPMLMLMAGKIQHTKQVNDV